MSIKLPDAENATPPIQTTLKSVLSGWKLTWLLIAAIVVGSTIAAWAVGGVNGANLGIRITARTSAILFLLAFTASSLYQLWPNDTTKWIRRNRRYLGVGFAGSHLVHAGFIVATIVLNQQRFETRVVDPTPHGVFVLDFIAYGFIIAMTITSFDRVAKRMRYSTWKALHLTGSYVIWFTFFIAYWRRGVTYTEFYGPFLMIVLAALIVRFIAKAKRGTGKATHT
ncbi:ferric reductase-like transmembrane domain-containing protein [Mycolicibacterium fortuitum]|uniref:ferric reductase-like transmembrane domain-containing protein n=1 Tax=Mycolicibacterium fortuitum TaxID=1766 RepID=UPI0009C072E0|nr:ferric reductase-like transmembrane domain-containing protein [Mycolicibacterium fortuitum]UBV20130.1 ferric reductase-like transmembrane domain-containing protein [Mycolicibacterium fortuitum]